MANGKSYIQADQTLVLMVWMESHIKVWGGVGRGDALRHLKSEVDIMASSLFYPWLVFSLLSVHVS